MTEPPTGTVTLIFTDVEGSSDLWEEHRDAFRAVLDRHNELIRQAAARHGGYEVKTEGDSFFLAFDRASEAVLFAVEAQVALARHAWHAIVPEVRQLRVRMGMHTGEPLAGRHPDGALDYFGPVVNRAARVSAAGHGGQILVSDTTRSLAQPEAPAEIEFLDLGVHRLSGVGEERLWQVSHPDLPRRFPPPRAEGGSPNNLPIEATPFVGRAQEVEAVRGALGAGRLVTLTGPGGAGKTRLALRVAAELLGDFPDGVFLVELAPIRDPGLVPSTIAQAIGIREIAARPLLDTLKEYLRDRNLLLVLDNFEQIVSAAPIAAEMLAQCRRLKLLVTSRLALRLQGEAEFPVPPLALPDLDRLPAVEALSQYAAVALFIQRALAVKPDFRTTNENAPAVAEICSRLDGLPLAIELAAARVKLLPPQAILARLGNRLDLLTGGSRDLPVRQQTLRGAIAWSYDLLDDETRAVFRRLAVFVGGWTLEAGEAVVSGRQSGVSSQDTHPIDVLEAIAGLVDHSLVRQLDHGDESRFLMLETVREYGLECLAAAGELEAAGRRHAGYFLALAEEAETRLLGPEQMLWLERLGVEHDNLRAALDRSREQDAEAALRLAGSLWPFWFFRGHLNEASERLSALRVLPGAAEHRLPYAKVLTGAGVFAYFRGDLPSMQALCGEALEVAREVHAPWHMGVSLVLLGALAFFQGDFDHAVPLCEESLAVARETGDPWLTAISLTNTALLALHQGDVRRAVELCRESIPLSLRAGDKWCIGHSHYNLGLVLLAAGDPEQALPPLRQGLQLCRELSYSLGIGLALDGLAGVRAARGDPAGAARLLGAGEALRETLGAAMPPAFQGVYQQIVAAARGRLSEEVFTDAWAEGRGMTLDQAIAFALEEVPVP